MSNQDETQSEQPNQTNRPSIPDSPNTLGEIEAMADQVLAENPGLSDLDEKAPTLNLTPQFRLDSEGKVRYLWMLVGKQLFRERVPLHVYKMEPEQRQFFMDQLTAKLAKQLKKKWRVT